MTTSMVSRNTSHVKQNGCLSLDWAIYDANISDSITTDFD